MTNNHDELLFKIKSISNQTDDFISILSNVASVLFEMDDVSWAGFYLLKNNKLQLGPFQGRVACTEIEIGSGVCGTSFADKKTLIVDDVHKFDGHIACDSRSNSEIVCPIYHNEIAVGVIDIDSTSFSRFAAKDKDFLEDVARIIGSKFYNLY